MVQETPAAATTRNLSVVLIGNPNTGKTTLFNALTGLRHRVGNYPGVTVETKTGTAVFDGTSIVVTDVPGTYSLSPRSPDEMLAVDLLLGHRPELPRPDVIVCIVDASNLERNLYLATQVLELGIPTVLALNMIDIAEKLGVKLDPHRLSESLGVAVVPTQANKKRGVRELFHQIIRSAGQAVPRSRPRFPDAFQTEINALSRWLAGRGNGSVEPYLLERAILDCGGYTETALARRCGVDLRARLAETRDRLKAAGCPIPAVEARTRYAWIADRLADAVIRPATRAPTLTDRLDRILIHRVWGLVVFLFLMAVIFQSVYSWAGPLMESLDGGFGVLGAWAADVLPDGPLRGLVVDGVIGGMGAVLVFLPQIVILFGFIAVLEDCGYMARAAFLMDKIMARCGLSGKSFIPMLSSFACAVPGIMATRTIEDRRDRFTTILVAPLMSCSARLPVYLLLIGAFIPSQNVLGFFNLQGMVLLAMYLIGLCVAPLVAWSLKRTVFRGEAPVFLMELPSYKLPSLAAVLHRMYDRGKAFVRRAGTLILATSIVIWALQYYPRSAAIAAHYQPRVAELNAQLEAAGADLEDIRTQIVALENDRAAQQQAYSFLGRMGRAIEPVVRPLGWDWRIGMAAIASFPAREVVIAALGTIYNVGREVDVEDDDSAGRLRAALRSAEWPDGSPVFSTPVALSLMVFFALCCQCAATLAVIKRETNSWRWPVFTFVYMTLLAYVTALAVYQIGTRLA
jgi:ferrous iron transport protein B